MSISSAQILELPASMLAVLPAGLPPTGVIPDFEHPQTIQPLVAGITSTLIVLCTIFFGLRSYNKIFVMREVWWDDLTCLLAYLCTVTLYAGMMAAIHNGPLGKHMYEIHVLDLFSNAWLIASTFITSTFTMLALLFLKTTFFLMYYTIFKPFEWMKWFCIIGGILSTAFYTAASIVQFYFASPKNGESFAEYDLSGEIYKALILSIPSSCVGLGIDVLLFIMPLIAVSKLNMPIKRKISTSLLFAVGSLAVLGATLSLYYRATFGLDYRASQSSDYGDATWASAPLTTAGIVECTFGLIVVCMPSVSKVVQHHKTLSFTISLFSRSTRLIRASGSSIGRFGWKSKDYDENKEDSYALSLKPMHKKYTTQNSSSDTHLEGRMVTSTTDPLYERSGSDHGILRTVEVRQYDETRTVSPQKPGRYF